MDNNGDTQDEQEYRRELPPGAVTPARRALTATGATLAIIAGTLAFVWLGTKVAHSIDPPRCYGIGWGCTPDATFATYIIGILYGAPAAGVTIILVWTAWAATRRDDDESNRNATWTPVALLAAVTCMFALISIFD